MFTVKSASLVIVFDFQEAIHSLIKMCSVEIEEVRLLQGPDLHG